MIFPFPYEKDIPLKKFSTFGIGGPAKFLKKIRSIQEGLEVFSFLKENYYPFIIIGKGSNCLFDDRGFNGLVIVNNIFHISLENNSLIVGSGVSLPFLSKKMSFSNLSGLEFASGIPGSVGGGVAMNAGTSNGEDISKNLVSVTFIDDNFLIVKKNKDELEFGYRSSTFQRKNYFILEATFKLTPSFSSKEIFLKNQKSRIEKQPLKAKSAGCIFKNPKEGSAGYFIDSSGLKNYKIGGASISSMHANFIINEGNASSHDVLSLIKVVESTVLAKTGIQLQKELWYIPYEIS